MSSDAATTAQEVTEDSQLGEDQTPTGKEPKGQINDLYTTPTAEHSPATPIGGSNHTALSSKTLSTQVEDLPVINNPVRVPLVPPRHKKRRVAELKCSEVRWFHRKTGTETKWTPFKG